MTAFAAGPGALLVRDHELGAGGQRHLGAEEPGRGERAGAALALGQARLNLTAAASPVLRLRLEGFGDVSGLTRSDVHLVDQNLA